MLRVLPLVVLLAVFVTHPRLAAQAGSWKPFSASESARPPRPEGATPAMVTEFLAQLSAVTDVFKRAPILASPSGWVMFPKREVVTDRGMLTGHLMLPASNFESDGRTVYDTASAFMLNLWANRPSCAINNAGKWAADAAGEMSLEPEEPLAEFRGFPVSQHCIVITHRTVPMYVPVALERVMKVRIAQIDERLAPLRGMAAMAETVAVYDGVLKELRDRLAKLSADERRAPARVRSAVAIEEPLTFDQGRRVVELNPQFFDRSRPADIQLLTVFEDCVREECLSRQIVDKLKDQLDWKALAALVR